MLNKPTITDITILEKIRNNDLQGWEELYELYAPAMLGIICRLTADKRKGEKLLIKIFTDTGFEELLKSSIGTTLTNSIYRYTFITTISLLKAEGIFIDAGVIEGLPGIFRTVYRKNQGAGIQNTSENTNSREAPCIWLPMYGINIYDNMIYYS